MSTSTRVRRVLATTTLAAATVAGSAVLAAPAQAATSPAGCGTPHKVNSAPIMYYVASSSTRVGTITQYWGWCNSQLRNWAHVHFSSGNSAIDIKVGIQTRNGTWHGTKTVTGGSDFTSKPTDTMNVDTRAVVKGTFFKGGGVATFDRTESTPWS